MKHRVIIQNAKRLSQVIIIGAIHQAKVFFKNHFNPREEKLTVTEKYASVAFKGGSSWSPIVATARSFRKTGNRTFTVPYFKFAASKSVTTA